ncbi:hypothetical protein COOONC_27480 [Cooperia oncophora]
MGKMGRPKGEFMVGEGEGVSPRRVPYDYGSLMHYHAVAHAIKLGIRLLCIVSNFYYKAKDKLKRERE